MSSGLNHSSYTCEVTPTPHLREQAPCAPAPRGPPHRGTAEGQRPPAPGSRATLGPHTPGSPSSCDRRLRRAPSGKGQVGPGRHLLLQHPHFSRKRASALPLKTQLLHVTEVYVLTGNRLADRSPQGPRLSRSRSGDRDDRSRDRARSERELRGDRHKQEDCRPCLLGNRGGPRAP